ncbi:MAG: hypothetical protein LAP13_22610 [Acidobacteriia bacterium]|nr:hypothetical protein [Terriglobia bacterium]
MGNVAWIVAAGFSPAHGTGTLVIPGNTAGTAVVRENLRLVIERIGRDLVGVEGRHYRPAQALAVSARACQLAAYLFGQNFPLESGVLRLAVNYRCCEGFMAG